jgi:hypothetical protein
MTSVVSVLAETARGSGPEIAQRAHQAWEEAEFDRAAELYKSAIEAGGLPPDELLHCWVALGSTNAVLGKKKAAGDAFRQAAIIDPAFRVPPEAGKRAEQIADASKRAVRRIGPPTLSVQVPRSVRPSAPFVVEASLDSGHVSTAPKLGIEVRDAVTGVRYTDTKPSSGVARFEVPTSVTVADAKLVVRIDALDAHENRIVSNEQRIQVGPAENAKGVASSILPSFSADPSANKDRPRDAPKRGGFWSSPWPYLLGGAALAAGGAAVYVVTRPPEAVSVGAPQLQTR